MVLAAGQGTRFGGEIPKQFLSLNHKPILCHCIDKFYQYDEMLHIYLVLNEDGIGRWKDLKSKFYPNQDITTIKGGDNRFLSVQNALNTIPDDGIVAIHDAVRPNLSVDLIQRSFAAAETYNSSIPYLPISDTLISDKDKISFENRGNFKRLQTPQCFKLSLLKEAYNSFYSQESTDDSTVWYSNYENLHFIHGEESNVKLTFADDLNRLVINKISTDRYDC